MSVSIVQSRERTNKILALVRVFSFVVAFINLVAINQPQRYVILEVYCELCVYACECRVCFTKEHFCAK